MIPEVLGGRLAEPILCNGCNHSFGSKPVSGVKADPSIILAVEGLRDRLSRLAEEHAVCCTGRR